MNAKLPDIKSLTLKDYFVGVILLCVSAFVHLWRISYPNSVVFDEVTFGKFLNSYIKGEYYFDLHPPLGKLIFAAIAFLGGANPDFNYDSIGTAFSETHYIGLRVATAMAGSVLPLCVAFAMWGFGFSRWATFVAGVLVIFENSLVVISRVFVFDIFLLSFGFASLAFGVWYLRTGSRRLGLAAWILAALALSVKWTGLSFVGGLIVLEILAARKEHSPRLLFRRLFQGSVLVLGVYFSFFWIHFELLPRSGMGDPFMSLSFQRGLEGSAHFHRADLQPPNILEKFIELNQKIWSYQKTMRQLHPYSSDWYSWPLMIRPIYFWGKTDGELKERIYLLGNPVLWWGALLGLFYFSWRTKFYRWRNWWESTDLTHNAPLLLIAFYLANLVPFIFISRGMFIYHYFSALIFGLMILAVILDQWVSRRMAWAGLFMVIVSFGFFSPLTYALPLSDGSYKWRVWLSTWI